jgi:class 3 adenylate cyclase
VGSLDLVVDWLKRWRRRGASPSTGIGISRAWNELDIRQVLPTVRVPTLVLRRVGCDVPADLAEHCRYVAEGIPEARYAEVPGVDHAAFVGETGPLLDAAEEFLVGTKAVVVDDRVFATVLFTDIVASTPRAAALGDRRWRELLDAHDEAMRHEVERFRGRLVKSTGDGILATFDGPARAVRCAQSIGAAVGRLDLEMRFGIHAGEVELRGEDITGIAVSIARRVCDTAATGELLVSRTVVDLVAGSGLSFDDRGEHELKGVPARWRLYAVAS